jgi:hypothetical protein
VDDAEKVKRLIAFANTYLKVKYVMLAGDANWGHVPVRHRFVSQPIGQPTSLSGTFNGTDHYYADLYIDSSGVAFNTWDSQSSPDGIFNDQRWGESPWSYNPDGVTGYPDIVVARVPAATEAQLALYVAKVIQYETVPLAGAKQFAFFANRTYDNNVCSLSEGIAQALEGDKEAVKTRVGLNFAANDSIDSGWRRGNPDDIGKAVAMAAWISYVGHGAPDAWSDALSFNSALTLQNNHNFPVVMSSGCETGQFTPNLPWTEHFGILYRDMSGIDHCFVTPANANALVLDQVDGSTHTQPLQVPRPQPYDRITPAQGRCMASAWLFATSSDGKPSGAIAYLGETIGLQPDLANEFQKNMLAAYNNDRLQTLGDVWRSAQIAHCQKYREGPQGADLNFAHPRIYLSTMTLFGDPSLRLRPSGRVLWRTADERNSLWSLDDAANQVAYKEHGPFVGWTAVSYARDRILWRNGDGRISLWRVDDQGNQISYKEHGPFAGWTVVNYAQGRILWRNGDGRVSLWRVDDQGNQISYKEHGPCAGWTAINYAQGRILWRHGDGRVSLWRVDDQGNQVSYKEHGPCAGWTAINYAHERILWRHRDGRISLWRVDDEGNQISYKEHGPFAGWTAVNYGDG